ncbi:phosphoglycolate phosphatase [Aminobacter anthyllidis]|uniref:Phosphoglycolate phosphatase n=1 Tax=Aminobacter anthyllidis TaxID=1035067 RepID=A0A9X1D307_9HYPH|nr:phosphoglycolate phosphatase [Aminobacter anthyllidis]MBT1154937.1 phosphoglycolate phosphatase [Aminobacter anthyllidis]MDH4989217.1 phosphoglycolate phosphatase [Aminobacter anthyllidis]
MSKPIIVFDLDGTLVDTAPDLLDSLNHTLVAGGLAQVDDRAFRRFVGQGGRIMIERAYTAQQKQLAAVEHDRLHDIFLDHYTVNIPGRSLPYPGVVAAMDRFTEAGYLLAVCTNKYETLAQGLIQALGLSNRFAAITGPETFGIRKPDPRHLTETIAKAGGDVSRAVMVGDSVTDIDTAKAAGIPVVAVDFGYTDRHVSEYEPSVVISHYDELTLGMAQKLIDAASR